MEEYLIGRKKQKIEQPKRQQKKKYYHVQNLQIAGKVDLNKTGENIEAAGGRVINTASDKMVVEMDGFQFIVQGWGTVTVYCGEENHIDDNKDSYCDICGINLNGSSHYYTQEEPGNPNATYVKYRGIMWMVLYNDSTHGVQLVTANTLNVNGVRLGYAEELEGASNEAKFASARESYNNMVSTLTLACREATGIRETSINIRSIGGPAEEPELTAENAVDFPNTPDDNTSDFESFRFNSASYPILTSEYITTNFEGANGFRMWDTKDYYDYPEDYTRMQELGITMADNQQVYWLASRYLVENSSNANFIVGCVNNYGYLDYYYLSFVSFDGRVIGHCNYFGVRPVITLSSGILDGLEGEGTYVRPFILND